MNEKQKSDIETLAKMAARLAGRDPEEYVTMVLAQSVPFEGPMWSYPDFLARAAAAYHALTAPCLNLPPLPNGHVEPVDACSDGHWSDSGLNASAPDVAS